MLIAWHIVQQTLLYQQMVSIVTNTDKQNEKSHEKKTAIVSILRYIFPVFFFNVLLDFINVSSFIYIIFLSSITFSCLCFAQKAGRIEFVSFSSKASLFQLLCQPKLFHPVFRSGLSRDGRGHRSTYTLFSLFKQK